ncbi:MAG: hexokinase [Treponema sp.]|nr:hexokinase [Treponema sp.]
MNEVVKKFLQRHSFDTQLNVESLAEGIRSDMQKGLTKSGAYQDMIRTYCNPSDITMKEKSVIVIDAGGTNFRSCIVTFSKDGLSSFSDFEKTKMPGTEEKLGKKDFFAQIAWNIRRFQNKCDEICFCFSYPMTITEDHDGILLGFSKEIQAPGVAGCHIGAELKQALAEQGWRNNPKVILVNDTVSALLAGTDNKYDSYVGFVLGTGLNCAYVQEESPAYPDVKKQVIVCESAKFGAVEKSDFDVLVDLQGSQPGTSPLEKLCSGMYLGSIGLAMLQRGAQEGLFSVDLDNYLLRKKTFTLIELSGFLEKSNPDTNTYPDTFTGATKDDCEIIFGLFDALVDRTARIAAAIIGACAVQSCAESNTEKTVCVACNGTTFFKTYKVPERTRHYLDAYLADKKVRYEILPEEADITRGTAMASFTA